jgi:hypothetical protein
MRRTVAVSFLLIAFATLSHGQSLKGVSTIGVISDIGDASSARYCGIADATVEAAMRIPLSNTRLIVKNDSASAFLYTNVNVLQMPTGTCAASISVELRRMVSVDSSSPRVLAEVWNNSHLMAGQPLGFGKRVSEKVEEFSKQFIGAWLKDN